MKCPTHCRWQDCSSAGTCSLFPFLVPSFSSREHPANVRADWPLYRRQKDQDAQCHSDHYWCSNKHLHGSTVSCLATVGLCQWSMVWDYPQEQNPPRNQDEHLMQAHILSQANTNCRCQDSVKSWAQDILKYSTHSLLVNASWKKSAASSVRGRGRFHNASFWSYGSEKYNAENKQTVQRHVQKFRRGSSSTVGKRWVHTKWSLRHEESEIGIRTTNYGYHPNSVLQIWSGIFLCLYNVLIVRTI